MANLNTSENAIEVGDRFENIPPGLDCVISASLTNGDTEHLVRTPMDNWALIIESEREIGGKYRVIAVGEIYVSIDLTHIKEQPEWEELSDEAREQVESVCVDYTRYHFARLLKQEGNFWSVRTHDWPRVQITPFFTEPIEDEALEGLEDPPDLSIRYLQGSIEIHE